MCELFGLSGNAPVALRPALAAFAERGGKAADNPDGWGLAYMESNNFVLHKRPEAAAGSKTFARLSAGVYSHLVIAHVRKANPPTGNILENTHPFIRECCHRQWVFAHNGKVPELVQADGCCHPRSRRPLGTTDSEHAFCFLLDEIARLFGDMPAGRAPWVETLGILSGLIASYGRFNFLMSDGEHLIAYGHDRLHGLQRRRGNTRLALVATEALTDEAWRPFRPGELQVYHKGERVAQVQTDPRSATEPSLCE